MRCKLLYVVLFMSLFASADAYVVRRAQLNDVTALVSLYKTVAAKDGGIARSVDEITEEYIKDIVGKACSSGLMLVAVEESGEMIGAVSKYRLEPKSLSYCFGGGTTLVHPDMQGKGIGKKLWAEFLKIVKNEFPDVARIELFVRESNIPGVRLYKSVGFEVEGRLDCRIINAKGSLEADLIMAWLNPNAKI